jgi:hypothetical protein
MRSTDFPFAVTPRREGPDYTAPSADVADLLNPTDIIGRGRLEARETSWRDQLRDKLAVRVGRRNADKLIDLADFTPVGAAFVGNEAALAAREGRRGAAAANVALAALPLPGAGKALKKVAKAPLAVKPQGITAYHGSPHTFDRFDMRKIGTGEGAQAYGHGLYFAENEGVAKAYRDALAGKGILLDGGASPITAQKLEGMGLGPQQVRRIMTVAQATDGDLFRVHQAMLDQRKFKPYGSADWTAWDQAATLINSMSGKKAEFVPAGSMYQVRIDADPADFLDYDAPLSGQSQRIRDVAAPRLEELRAAGARFGDDPDGAFLAKAFSPQGGTEKTDWSVGPAAQASARMREAGIPGIKYLDQGSRGAGDGTRNYVVFDDKLISILKRYGWAPGMAIPAAAMEEYEAEQEFARGGFAVTPDNYDEKVRLLREYGMLD